MKGIIFMEFMEMAESKYGYQIVDRIVENANMRNEGVFNANDSYDHKELMGLVNYLSKEVGYSVSSLMKMFGEHLFSRFVIMNRSFFAGRRDVFEVLEHMNSVFYNNVGENFLDSHSPFIYPTRVNGSVMEVLYRSPMKMPDLAVGLIKGCQKYFHEDLNMDVEYLSTDGSVVKLILCRN